jgi:intergrase/recombinase
VRFNVDWNDFRKWVFGKYAKTYAPTVYSYAKRYAYVLNGNPRKLATLKGSTKNTALKSLTALAKYLGIYEQFKSRLSAYGIKYARSDCFSAFLRMINASSSDLMEWYAKAHSMLRHNERMFLRFTLTSGLRKGEAINSFNLIIDLAKQNCLEKYYNDNLSALEHFKFKNLFLREKKNTYITFISKAMVYEIANCEPITYEMIRKRLLRKNLKCRITELRDYFATFMVRHGLIREEVDLLQGRIPPSIFIRHYWSPNLKELMGRTLSAINQLEQTL